MSHPRDIAFWVLLNVLLPGSAALFTFIFTKMTLPPSTVDTVLGKAFSGGENCVVAGVLFASIYFETQRSRGASIDKLIDTVAGVGALFFAFSSFVLYGAFKAAHLVDSGPSPKLPEVHHAGALVSVGLLAIACVLALLLVVSNSMGKKDA
jgi:hypothetical protein